MQNWVGYGLILQQYSSTYPCVLHSTFTNAQLLRYKYNSPAPTSSTTQAGLWS